MEKSRKDVESELAALSRCDASRDRLWESDGDGHGCARASVTARPDEILGYGRRGGGYGVVRSGICRWVEHG